MRSNNQILNTFIIMCSLMVFVILPNLKTSAQSIENIRTTADNERVIIEYDLVGGLANTMNVLVRIKINDTKVITPANISGDLNGVLPGNNKRIVWDALKEIGSIDAKMEVEINVKQLNLLEYDCMRFCFMIDSIYHENQLEEALRLLDIAKECTEEFISVRNQANDIKKKILRKKISSIQANADLHFTKGEYELALDLYRSILKLDPDVIYKEKIKQIEDQQIFLLKRTNTIFSYSQTNQVGYKSLKNHIARVVNLEALTNTSGSLSFNHLVEFDTSGRRKSGISDIQSNLPGIESRLNKIDFFTYLSPSRERGYFVASREILFVNSSWSTNRVHYHLDFKSIHNGNYSTTRIHSIDSFMRIHSKTYGDFYFDVKHKKLNEKSFYDIRLSKYRVRGPLNALYSLAIPGLGSSRVSYGEVGKSRLGGFLLFSALSVGSRIYSSIQYDKYMQATNQAEIESLYMKSNIANKVFLVSGGIAVSFYLYDFVWAVNRGVKNSSNSRELKRQIKSKEFFVQKSDLSW